MVALNLMALARLGGIVFWWRHSVNLARLRLAEAIHRERMAQNLSMKQLAERAYTTPATISRIENAQMSIRIDVDQD